MDAASRRHDTLWLWLAAAPGVLLSTGMLLVAFGWLGSFLWVPLLGWLAAAPLICADRVRARAAGGGVTFRRRSDLALLWLTAPWAVSWHVLRRAARWIPLGRASLVLGLVILLMAVALALRDGAVGAAVVLLLVGYLTAVFPRLNGRLIGPSLF